MKWASSTYYQEKLGPALALFLFSPLLLLGFIFMLATWGSLLVSGISSKLWQKLRKKGLFDTKQRSTGVISSAGNWYRQKGS